jgi:hypothetical protein
MGTTVNFTPSNIKCQVLIPPGGITTGSTSCGNLPAPANITAEISDDTSGGALTLISITSFQIESEVETPDPGEGPGGKNLKPIKIEVPVQVGQSNGAVPLAVAAGQYVEANIQFAPIASTPGTSTALLLVKGDTWNPSSVSIQLVAVVGQVSVAVPSISMLQGDSKTVEATISCPRAGTTVNLALTADGLAHSPNVAAKLSSTSLTIGSGQNASTKLTASAGSTLAAGKYLWTLSVSAFGGDYYSSVSVPIEVTALKTLTITHTPAQLLIAEPNTLTINATDPETGRAVDGLKVIVAAIFSGLTPESPHSDGVTGTALQYSPNINDSSATALVLGAPTYKNYEQGIPLVYPTPKVWYTNSDPNNPIIYGSGFIGNLVNITVDREGGVSPGPYTGNIAKGIPIRIDCINPSQYWVIHVTGIALSSQTVTTNVYCPSA